MFVKNLSRIEAKAEVPEPNSVWISITEPKKADTDYEIGHFDCALSTLPKLELSFWDVNRIHSAPVWNPKIQEFEEEIIRPATDKDIEGIYNFIIEHVGKNFYINCRQGVSRSAAICEFIWETWKCDWPEQYKNRAKSNQWILKKLRERWENRC